MEKAKYSIGLDVGSTTAKVAVIDGKKNLIYSKYERHNARVKELRCTVHQVVEVIQ